MSSSESTNSLASFANTGGEIETYLIRDTAGVVTMTLMGIKVEKVNWVMGELISVSRVNAAANSGDTLIDLSNG